jgi:two-component system sensor histidine kinase SaeS
MRGKTLGRGLATLAGLTALVTALAKLTLDADTDDLWRLALFLLISGGASLAAGAFITRSSQVRLLRSVRAKLLAVLVLSTFLVLVNVGFTAELMFIEPHDLTLLALLMAFALGLGVFLALSMAQVFHEGLAELLARVRLFGAGKLDTRIQLDTGDELEELGEAFNMMAEQLEASFAQQAQLERARRDLIASVSHDLRTPLATMRAVIESINDGVVEDPATVQRYLRTIQSEVTYLGRLIDDLFELSQIDSGLLKLRPEPSNVADLVSDTLEALSQQARQRGLTLRGEVDDMLPEVVMDTPRMQRVLYNLVQNAVRHTPADGTIVIRAIDAGPEVEVSVIDTGEGIEEHELPRIFERFYRVDKARTRDDGGSGLGLSIAKGIVELHGGRIWARSTRGEGAEFTFALPKGA